MVNELKPCPYCGHPRSRLLFKREYCEDREGHVAVRYRICRACNKCGARGGYVFTDPLERDACPKFEWARAHRAEADGKWNRRDGERRAD